MRTRYRRLVVIPAALVGAAALYAGIIVLRARAHTPEIVRATMAAHRIELAPEDLTPDQLHALLIVQDPHFFSHRGWDFAGGTMTTVTQSLAKGFYFEGYRRGVLAKVEQSLLARFALDPLVSKRDQLTLFINTVYLGTVDGRPVEGLAEGARVFFKKPFRDLTFNEYLALLVFDAPNRLNPHADPAASADHVRELKRRLVERAAST
jgi:membrane carboxypeptidase/penicillin-binding protein